MTKHIQKRRATMRRKKMTGGTSFNQSTCFSSMPRTSFYDHNTFSGDPSRSPFHQDMRSMTGGRKRITGKSKRNVKSRRSKTMGRFRRTKILRRFPKRQMGGGSIFSSDPLLGTKGMSSPVLAGGTSGGTSSNLTTLLSGGRVETGPPVPYTPNIPSYSSAMV